MTIMPPTVLSTLLLLLLPTICIAEIAEMELVRNWQQPEQPLVVHYGNNTGNGTDPNSGENELAQDIVGYTLIGIVVVMFLFAVCTFGKSVCIGCKNVSID